MIFAAALVFVLATFGVVGFQCALALGAPWGRLAMGGRFPGRLPGPMRAAAVVQALVLILAGGVVLARAGLAFHPWAAGAPTLILAVVGLSAVSLLLNLITPSREERRLWAPVAAVMLASSLVVALLS
jgi:hypothetical protein